MFAKSVLLKTHGAGGVEGSSVPFPGPFVVLAETRVSVPKS